MIDFFKRKRAASASRPEGGPPFYFKDGNAAFECACKYMDCRLTEGNYLPALVLDSRELMGANYSAVAIGKDGNQIAMLRVASDDGGFLVIATTVGPRGPKLQPGQLVSWQAGAFSPEVAAAMGSSDKRSGWVGLIVGTLKPEHHDGAWVGDERFLP